MQQTIAKEIEFSGIGLHSGANVKLTLKPADENTGVVFKRTDVENATYVKALYKNVCDTRNCTCLADENGNIVSTIEHLMAALYILQIDNVYVEVNSPEMPIMDGSAKIFFDEIKKIGVTKQNKPRKKVKVLKKVEFTDDKGNKISLEPADKLVINFEIEFPSKIVGHQKFDEEINENVFAEKIAPCRTFCEKTQIDYLRSIGLIKGGSLDNAVVLDGDSILNPEGFKVENECVNHKVLDAIGDMYSAGMPVVAKVNASKTGHYHNNQILKILFGDEANYQII